MNEEYDNFLAENYQIEDETLKEIFEEIQAEYEITRNKDFFEF